MRLTAARIIVHHEGGTEEWTPERVESNTPLRMGERIRFSFESPQPGYLYVIDREQYAGGSMSDPSLIFPTTRTREGDNRVTPGQIIEIPAQNDRPNFFTLRRSRLDQTGELLTVIVTPQPIEGITISGNPLPLSSQQVAQWEKQWGALTEKFEMADGAGKIVDKSRAGSGRERHAPTHPERSRPADDLPRHGQTRGAVADQSRVALQSGRDKNTKNESFQRQSQS